MGKYLCGKGVALIIALIYTYGLLWLQDEQPEAEYADAQEGPSPDSYTDSDYSYSEEAGDAAMTVPEAGAASGATSTSGDDGQDRDQSERGEPARLSG